MGPIAAGAQPYFWLQPAVTGAAGVLVLLGAAVTVWQRQRADRRQQWWTRTQWAIELVLRPAEDAVVLGLEVLAQQVTARVADREDAVLINEVLSPLMDSATSQ